MGRWANKVVVVAGGSTGLGFAVAREFGQRGAIPILLSRAPQNLTRAVEALRAAGIAAESQAVDVLDETALQAVVTTLHQRHGGIDVLVNAVGRSTRIELDKADPGQYRELFELNVISAIHCTRACLPALQARRGHVVNIGSLSSKTAWPFLAPYTVSKFALAGYTRQLQVEGPPEVHFMLVCPGPIRRADAGQRYERGDQQMPPWAMQPGAGAQIDGLEPSYVARRIVRGCERRSLELVLSWRARLLFLISVVSPALATWILRRLSRS